MPLIGAAIVPHSPLLLKTIGKEYMTQTKHTQQALTSLKAEIHALQPQVLLILHPHGNTLDRSFAANVSDKLSIEFAEFGDLVTTASFNGTPVLAHHLKEKAEDQGFPLVLTTNQEASYDVGVPLVTLTTVPAPLVLPIASSNLDAETHVGFGRMIADVLGSARERVFVLASAELSHHISKAAPGGERPEGKVFDRAIQKSLGKPEWTHELLTLDQTVVELADACGYQILLSLSGVVSSFRARLKKLSYESPFGIGLLTTFIFLP